MFYVLFLCNVNNHDILSSAAECSSEGQNVVAVKTVSLTRSPL